MGNSISDVYGPEGLPAKRIRTNVDLTAEDFEDSRGFFFYAASAGNVTVRPVFNSDDDGDLPALAVTANSYLTLGDFPLPLKAIRMNSSVTGWICYSSNVKGDPQA
ncbi:MAG: hypothetical protein OXI23_05450 [Gemmatimonadota bacterium]|nr:hypothetical protein [Gemmatimonadota bacterium]